MQYAWKIVGTGVPDGPWHHVVSEFRALRELDDDDATIPESRLWRAEPESKVKSARQKQKDTHEGRA